MKNPNLSKSMSKLFPLLMVAPFAFATVACSSDELTAENVTLEECEMLFGADAEEPDEDAVEGDYNDDGEADDDDAAIAERCVELMAEAVAEEASESTEEAAE